MLWPESVEICHRLIANDSKNLGSVTNIVLLRLLLTKSSPNFQCLKERELRLRECRGNLRRRAKGVIIRKVSSRVLTFSAGFIPWWRFAYSIYFMSCTAQQRKQKTTFSPFREMTFPCKFCTRLTREFDVAFHESPAWLHCLALKWGAKTANFFEGQKLNSRFVLTRVTST